MGTDSPKKVYFFASCLVDLLYPAAGLSAMNILRQQDVKVIFPDNQGCCGQPAFNSGYREEAYGVARALMNRFPKDIPVVVPSASCAGMLKHHWPELFAGRTDELLALDIASRTFELTEYLVTELDIKLSDLGEPVQVAIHSSCSAQREMRVSQHIESLVGQLDQVDVIKQQRQQECCGFGGTFSVKQADISGAMVEDKTSALRDTGAQIVISQDCGCLMNIGTAFEKQSLINKQSAPLTKHIAEFIWERCHASD